MPVYRTFDTKQQAQPWARRVDGEMDSGAYIDPSEPERMTLREALKRHARLKREVFLDRLQLVARAKIKLGFATRLDPTLIVKFDPETRRGVTGSGRIYELVGERGADTKANYLWAVSRAQADMASMDVSSEYDQPEIASLRPVAPYIANLFCDGGPARLSAKVPATGQSFEAQDPEDLAELLFARGVRQGYLRLPDSDRIEHWTAFVDLVRAVEHRLNQLERDLPRDADGTRSAEW